MAEPGRRDVAGGSFPRVPNYAWSWLQRSRPVLAEAARRLVGGPPPAGFVDRLREEFAADAFTRDVLIDVIADVAFNGRVPRHRPPGASWDRGLTWWAAAIAGTTPAEFDSRPPPATQSRLFDEDDVRSRAWTAPAPPPASIERHAVVAALRDLLRTADGGYVPVAALESLIAHLVDSESGNPKPADRRRRK